MCSSVVTQLYAGLGTTQSAPCWHSAGYGGSSMSLRSPPLQALAAEGAPASGTGHSWFSLPLGMAESRGASRGQKLETEKQRRKEQHLHGAFHGLQLPSTIRFSQPTPGVFVLVAGIVSGWFPSFFNHFCDSALGFFF